jgi:hypothetical protein
MKVKKQTVTLPIINIDNLCETNSNESRKHGALLPNSVRAIISGPSSSGKSNVLLSLLLSENGLRFENVYVYSKSLHQPKYKFLEKVLTGIAGYHPYKDNDEVISPGDAKSHSIIVFDDVSTSAQQKIREFYCMGRHCGVESLYLCQSYTHIPKHLIRDNANFLILFKQDDMNLKHIFMDHVSSDMTFDTFKQICHECWRDKYGFLTIDKDSVEGRYRRGIDEYISIE